MFIRDNIIKIVKYFLSIILSILVALVFSRVVGRYIFNLGLTWIGEITRMMFVWLTFLGAYLGYTEDFHIGMEIFTNIIPTKVKNFLDIIGNLLIIWLSYILFFGGIELVKFNVGYLAPASGVQMYYMYLVVPISAFLIIFEALYKIYFKIKKFKEEI